MSTGLIHVMTIIGKASKKVEAACDELLEKRVERNPKEIGTDDWLPSDHQAIEGLCRGLLASANRLPVLYYSMHLDAWSAGFVIYKSFEEWPDGKRRWIFGSDFGLTYYPSRFSDYFLMRMKKLRRTRVYREQREDRWYLDRMEEAFEAALWLKAPFLVVSINHILDTCRSDEDIRAALNMDIDDAHPVIR